SSGAGVRSEHINTHPGRGRMERRDLLRALGAAAAFTLMPRTAHAAWETVASSSGAPPRVLTDERSALVAALADAIIPRTDTPGASDVGVTAFIDVIVAEYYCDDERAVFLSGLDSIRARVQLGGSASFAEMTPDARRTLFDSLDQPLARPGTEGRAGERD